MNNIEQNPKLGFYRVGDRTFYSKPMAYVYATEINVEPVWHFNNVEFARVNWIQEPEVGIRELYRMRAQQLRDRYDYIRLELSGGSDSTTVVYSFLLNGIHLDEVVFRYPENIDKNQTNDPFNMKPENTLSERQFAAEPLLRWIKTNFPKTKITVQDYGDALLKSKYMKDESWVYTTRDWFQPGHGIKHDNFGNRDHIELADSGKSICSLYGIDKPKITLADDQWYIYFMDLQANGPNPVIGDHKNITAELFYWSPDLPEMLVKQAHMIKTWFEMEQNAHARHLVQNAINNSMHRTSYENIVKSIIYPDYDLETWQTSKPTGSFFNEMDHWFHVNLKDTKIYSAWESGLEFLLDKIDHKYFYTQLGRPAGLRTNFSIFYSLGPSKITKSEPAFKNHHYLTSNKHKITVVSDRKIKKTTL